MIRRWFSKGPAPQLSVLMVCMGNICRSPMAEAVLRQRLQRQRLEALVRVDSAGTHGFHRGNPPDPRSVQHAQRRGYSLQGQRSRPLVDEDFTRFDLLLAMDEDNLANLQDRCPEGHEDRLSLLLAHAPALGVREVPDPYYSGPAAFDHALDLIEAGVDGLMPGLLQRLNPAA